VKTTGVWVQSETPEFFLGKMVAGIEYYSDRVNSYLRKYNAAGALTSTEIQGPVADNSSYDLLGIFVQDEVKLTDKMDLTIGIRYTGAEVKADNVKDPAVTTPTQIALSDNWSNTVGILRLLYRMKV